MDAAKEQERVEAVDSVITSIDKLISQEEAKPIDAQRDIRHLEDALDALRQFQSNEMKSIMPNPPSMPTSEVIDTEVLTGPINGLKNFLMKKAQRND